MDKHKLRKLMKQNAKAHHNLISDDYFDSLSFSMLLSFCHPLERQKFIEMNQEIEREAEHE